MGCKPTPSTAIFWAKRFRFSGYNYHRASIRWLQDHEIMYRDSEGIWMGSVGTDNTRHFSSCVKPKKDQVALSCLSTLTINGMRYAAERFLPFFTLPRLSCRAATRSMILPLAALGVSHAFALLPLPRAISALWDAPETRVSRGGALNLSTKGIILSRVRAAEVPDA
jgi:hypothetical protein